MDTDRFIEELTTFLTEARVNLGRKNTKTKEQFIEDMINLVKKGVDGTWKPKDTASRRNSPLTKDTVLCLKPSDPTVKKRLHADKGGHVATVADAQRADDRIGNNPMG